MYVSLAQPRVSAPRAAEPVQAFRDRARLPDEADGFVDLQVWKSDRDYTRSEAHSAWHRRVDPDLDAAINLQALEHLHSYRVVAECRSAA